MDRFISHWGTSLTFFSAWNSSSTCQFCWMDENTRCAVWCQCMKQSLVQNHVSVFRLTWCIVSHKFKQLFVCMRMSNIVFMWIFLIPQCSYQAVDPCWLKTVRSWQYRENIPVNNRIKHIYFLLTQKQNWLSSCNVLLHIKFAELKLNHSS